MSEDERRALWAAALGVSQEDLYGSDDVDERPEADADEERLRRAG